MADDVIIRLATRGAAAARADIKGVASEMQGIGRSVERASSSASSLDRLSARLKTTTDEARRASEGLTQTGQSMTLFATLPIAAGLFKAEQAASDLNEVLDFTPRVFGTAGDAILSWSQRSLETLGLSRKAALEAANGFGTMLKAAGATDDQAASLSQQLVQLAVDTTSAVNPERGLQQALEAVRGALIGEYDPAQRLSLIITEKGVAARAAAESQGALGTALTENQRIIFRVAELLDQGAKYQGNYAATADMAANSQRRAGQAAAQAGADFGQTLIPLAIKTSEVIQVLGRQFEGLPESVQMGVAAVTVAAGLAGPILTAAGGITQLVIAKRTLSAVNLMNTRSMAAETAATVENAASKQAATVATGQLTLALEGESAAASGAAASNTRNVATIGRYVGIIGLAAGAAVGLKKAWDDIRSGPEALKGDFAQLGRATDEQLAAAGGDILKLPGGFVDKQATFRAIAEANIGTAKRMSAAMQEQGLDMTMVDRAIARVAAENRRLGKDQRDAAGSTSDLDEELKQLIAGAGTVASGLDAAAQSAKSFADNLDRTVNPILDAAAAGRSYTTELDKLDVMVRPLVTAEAEHADRVRELGSAQRDAAQATRSRGDAERELADVRAESLEQLREKAALARREAELRAQEAGRTTSTAQSEVARLTGDTASTPQQIADAKAELERATIDAARAQSDATKAREDEARVGPDHERRLAEATERVADAKDAEAAAQDKAVAAYLRAQVPVSELGTTTAELADQLDRVIRAAQSDFGAKLAAGLITPQQAAEGLYATMSKLGSLVAAYPDLALMLAATMPSVPEAKNVPVGGGMAVRAAGGPTRGWAVVGEDGPEIAYFGANGGTVYPNSVYRAAAGGLPGLAAGGVVGPGGARPLGASLFGGGSGVLAISVAPPNPEVVVVERVVRQTRIDNVNFVEQRRLRGALDDIDNETRRRALTS